MANTEWLSVHIYYNDAAEAVLTGLIRPLSKLLQTKEVIKSFFYIRYHDEESGYHIRFRVKPESEKALDKAKKMIISRTDIFSQKSPKKIKSYKFTAYEPETLRYGGTSALIVAEDHFHQSSKLILELLAQNKNWDYEKGLSAALTVHLMFLYEVGFDRDAVFTLVTNLTGGWLTSAVSFFQSTLKERIDDQSARKQVLNFFSSSFNKQKSVILDYYVELWRRMTNGEDFHSGLKAWRISVSETHRKLKKLHLNHEIDFLNFYGTFTESCTDDDDISLLYESYLHMTNNRLGLLNMDEAFIGYLLFEIIKELSEIGYIKDSDNNSRESEKCALSRQKSQ